MIKPKLSELEAELQLKLGVTPDKRVSRQDYLHQLAMAGSRINDYLWSILSEEAQAWINDTLQLLERSNYHSEVKLKKADRVKLHTMIKKSGYEVVEQELRALRAPEPKIPDFPKPRKARKHAVRHKT